jgi:hypothetical protein
MPITAVVSVPLSDLKELNDLASATNSAATVESRALDGATTVQLVIPVTVGTVALLRTWLLSRLERHKTSSVSWRGNVFVGYTPEEIGEIVQSLDADRDQENDD